MSWSLGFDTDWNRDIGYGVPAYCDHPECNEEIDRGLGYVCGEKPYGGEDGCGLYFCSKHQVGAHQNCERCAGGVGEKPFFEAKPDHPNWLRWKLKHSSWKEWRIDNPGKVMEMRKQLLEAEKKIIS